MEITRAQLEKWIEKLISLSWNQGKRDVTVLPYIISDMQSILNKDNDIIKCPICRADMINLGIYNGRRYYRCEDCNWVVSVVEK